MLWYCHLKFCEVTKMETVKNVFRIICTFFLLIFVAILNAIEGMIYAFAWIIYYIDHGLHFCFKKILDATDYMFQKFNIFTIYNEFRE